MNPCERRFELSLHAEHLAITRLAAGASLPPWATAGPFFSVTRTADELSVVCARQNVPEALRSKTQWRALKVRGPLVLSEIGVLSALAAPLAEAKISLFAISTFDTDYLLVDSEQVSAAIAALERAGHAVRDDQDVR